MMNKKISGKNMAFAAAFALLVMAFAVPVLAQSQCLQSVDTSTSASRITTGTSVTVTVTTTGTSCTVSTLVLVSSPSLTVNDPADGQYSGFSAGTTKTFTITAGTAGTYTYYAQGTTSAGSVSSDQKTLDFVSPSDMTVSTSPSSASVTNGNSFDLSINIQNAQSSAVTTSYALNLPSGLTRQSGDPTSSSGTTVSASSTKTLSLNIKHSTCFEGIKLITFDLGGSTGVASVSVTGNASGTCSTANASSSSGSGSGSGAAGGGAAIKTTKAYSTGKATVSIPVISGNATEIVDLDATETSVRKIEITVKGIARSITVLIEQSKLPLGIPIAPGTISHYISITKTNLSDENIASGKLEFRVEKSWITGKKINDATVALYRYTNAWQKMVTTKTSADDTYVYYSAALPGLSLFAISGEKTPEGQAEQAQQQNQSQQEQQNQTNQTNQTSQTQSSIGGIDSTVLIVLIVVLVVILGVVFFMFTKKGKGYSFKPKSK